MQKVKDILLKKGAHIESVKPDTPVIEALHTMAEKNYGSIAVMENGQFLGVMTERDYSRKVILKGKSSAETPVSEIMSTDLPIVSPDDTIGHCMSIMNSKNVRYLPVYDGENLCGLISMTDVVRATISEQEATISHLESYISRSY
ncbi:MAG: CBS domain-containing protein [Chitinophagaceae bacterium]|jgi:CBS domain-containing protein|nr:CBS domain-containing protein [Chitinophagaceae bacterium]MCU0404553.1 CBS domain-containing protein [Chitinophagaceae bacterium]